MCQHCGALMEGSEQNYDGPEGSHFSFSFDSSVLYFDSSVLYFDSSVLYFDSLVLYF